MPRVAAVDRRLREQSEPDDYQREAGEQRPEQPADPVKVAAAFERFGLPAELPG